MGKHEMSSERSMAEIGVVRMPSMMKFATPKMSQTDESSVPQKMRRLPSRAGESRANTIRALYKNRYGCKTA